MGKLLGGLFGGGKAPSAVSLPPPVVPNAPVVADEAAKKEEAALKRNQEAQMKKMQGLESTNKSGENALTPSKTGDSQVPQEEDKSAAKKNQKKSLLG